MTTSLDTLASSASYETRHVEADNTVDEEPLFYNGSVMRRIAKSVGSLPGKIGAGLMSAIFTGLTAGMIYAATPKRLEAATLAPYLDGNEHISSISGLLNSCPKSDPAYNILKNSLKIRVDGVLVDWDSVPCTEPVMNMPDDQYKDPLLVIQTLRMAYWADKNRKGHLPYFPEGSHWEWMMAQQMKGINVSTTIPSNYCCSQFDGELPYINSLLSKITEKSIITP